MRIGEEVGNEIVAHLGLRELGEVFFELALLVAPGEVGVRLGEARFGERLHHLRAGERFGEEDRLGVGRFDLGDEPRPKRDRLGVRVVDPEDGDPVRDPKHDHAVKFSIEAGPIGGVEVDAVDVLVLVGRIFGVPNASVGAMLEPRGVLFHPRVVGRALDGKVERDLDAHGAGRRDEMVEVGQRAEQRIDGGVPSVAVANGPGAAGVAGLGVARVVLPLAIGYSDGMHRRDVDDVESHRGELGEPSLGLAQRGPDLGISALGPREELVPIAEVGPLALGEDAQHGLAGDQIFARVELGHGT